MIKNLAVVVSGGALAFGLAGTVSPAMAWASTARPSGVTQPSALMSGPTPIIRDARARPGGGPVTIFNPGNPPVIRRSTAGGPQPLSAQPDTPTVRDSGARPGCGHPGPLRLWNPAAPPTVRDSTAQNAPPTIRDLTAQNEPPTVRDARARTGGAQCIRPVNPPDTPVVRGSAARFGDPDDGGQVRAFAALGDPDDGGQ